MIEKLSISLILISGIILGVMSCLIAVLFVAWVSCAHPDSLFFNKFLSPVITSIATLLAATGAIIGVIKSINNQNKLHQNNHDRKLSAARAALPLALREIEETCISALKQLTNDGAHLINKPILISKIAHETIKLVVEHSDGKVHKDLSDFLMYYQIVISRFNQYKIESDINPYLNHLNNEYTTKSIIYWESFRSIAEVHLDWARNSSKKFNNEKACRIFKKRFPTYKNQGRYMDITDAEFKSIFGEAINCCYPGFLKPNYFG